MRLYFLSIWSILDPIYYLFTRLTYLEDCDKERNVFRIRLTRYRGRDVLLSDGTYVKKNDLLIKIHLHNVRLMKEMHGLDSETKKGRLIFTHVRSGLPSLAEYVKEHPNSNEIKGVIGITMLHKGCNRLGFETFPIKNRIYKLIKQIVFIPMYCLSVSKISSKSLKRPPKYLFMSKKTLLGQYLQKG
ncbi:hypothetical protein PY093_03195 [Cytobacillus sp. S13-E01]|nr:hypothetical protein [Cytobacillus sp. S13-E01]MDF0725718.1 hypothetical protein [Cytobacillus sp. S13-E01]